MGPNTPPTTQDVVRRLKILHWVVGFAFKMPPPGQWPQVRARLSPQQLGAFMADVSSYRDRLCAQLRSSWHWAAMTNAERQLAQTLSCEVNEQQWLDAIWCLEAVGVLLWALIRSPRLFSRGRGEPVRKAPRRPR